MRTDRRTVIYGVVRAGTRIEMRLMLLSRVMRFLWISKVHYSVQQIPLLVPVLSQMKTRHIITPFP
jgi:hypothetical protein